MHFANESEIERWIDRFASHPILACAANTLNSLKDGVNSCSDGWCHWAAPVKAANRLVTLLEEGDNQLRDRWSYGKDAITATEADLLRAYSPIKAFVTRYGPRYGFSVELHYPPVSSPAGEPEPLTLFS